MTLGAISAPSLLQVVAVGSGKADDDGNISKPNLSVGDTVLYSKYAGVEFEVKDLKIFSQSGLPYMRNVVSNPD